MWHSLQEVVAKHWELSSIGSEGNEVGN
jgi:hypothetical protein